MQRWLGAALLAAVAGAVQARHVVLTPAQLRDDGFRAMAAGDARDAHAAALALIGRDPKDFLAQILRSRSARALGLNAEARAAARTAWALRRTPQDGYVAATVRAQALASSDMRVMAQLWLRKAADLAPSPVLRAQAIRDLAYVRSRSHWAFKLSASLMPSSNVNNGSASSTVSIFGLPFQLSGSAQALSGLVATTDATAIWRLTPTERTVSQATLRGVATHNWLSASAKAQAPGVQGNDFDYDALEAGFSQKFRFSVQDLTIFNWSVLAGHAWYGGRDLSTYGRLSFGAERALAPKLTGALGFSLERQLRQDSFSNSAVIWSGWGSLTRPLANGDQLQATVGLSDTQSASVTVDNRSGYVELDWSKAKPVAGMLLGLSVFAQTGKYGPSIYAAGGRRDLTLAGQATIAFPKAAYMGFAPELTLQLRNVNSNVGLYQAQTFGLGLGIRSVF